MQPFDVQTIADALTLIDKAKQTHSKIAVTDLDGVLRGKYIAKDKLVSAFKSGFGFCDVILGWDSNDQLYNNSNHTGWHTGFPDALVQPIPETCRTIPWENEILFFLAEFSGTAKDICPRNILKRVISKAKSMGFLANAAAEYEFFLFNETPETIREKNYRNLTPFTPGNFGYSIIRNSVHSEFHNDFIEMCEKMGFPIEGYHTETGPGVMEAAIRVDEILSAADKAILFKTFTKIFAQKRGLMATFMAKWSMDYPGQSGHIHMSLTNLDGKHVFHNSEKHGEISDIMRWFIGGQQTLLPEFMSLVAPTINSYTRIVPGLWAPVNNSWGVDNRTVSIRAILGSPESQRVEYRLGSADGNPYLSMAAALASGLWGIENKIIPTDPVLGNGYSEVNTNLKNLPKTLQEATSALKTSDAAKSYFGCNFINHYAATREWEVQEYQRQVTDWQLDRYFEII
jgi:glutamine synthetase